VAWRETNTGKWDRFDCTSIRIGDYELTSSCAGGTQTTSLAGIGVQAMVFSDFGIFYQFPHFSKESKFQLLVIEKKSKQVHDLNLTIF